MRACAAAARLADRALQPRLRRPFRRRAGSGAGDPTTAACGHPAREPHARRDAVTPPSVGALLRASFELYRRHVRLVLIVTVPIVILVTGLTALGLGELRARVRPAPRCRGPPAIPPPTRPPRPPPAAHLHRPPRQPPRNCPADNGDPRAPGRPPRARGSRERDERRR